MASCTLLLAWIALLAWTTRDINPSNRETLFLDAEQSQSLRAFQQTVPEGKTMVVRWNLTEPLNQATLERIQGFKAHLLEEFADEPLSILDAGDLVAPGKGFTQARQVQAFLQRHPPPSIRLVGSDFFGWMMRLPSSSSHEVVQALCRAVEGFDGGPGIAGVDLAGLPWINEVLNRYSGDIKTRVFPLVFVLTFLLSAWFLKSPTGALLHFLPPLAAFFLALASIQWLYGSLNMITSTLPVLVFVINLSVSLHLHFASMPSYDMAAAIRQKRSPLTLMVMTTCVGFGSLVISDIPAIRQFAVLSFFLMATTPAMTALWLWLMAPVTVSRPAAHFHRFERLLLWRPPRRGLVLACVVWLLASLAALPGIRKLTDATAYLPVDSHYRLGLERIHRTILGNPNYEILIQRKDGNSLTFDDLQAIRRLERDLENDTLPGVQQLSANRLIQEIAQLTPGLPTSSIPSLVYETVYHALPAPIRHAYPKDQVYRLSLLGAPVNAGQFQTQVQAMNANFSAYPDFAISINGLQASMMHAQNRLINLLARSFGLTLIIITLMAWAYFKRGRVIPAFLWVNLLPVLGAFMVMRIFGLSINIATVMTFSISLGLIVDSTIHITHDYLTGVERSRLLVATLLPVVVGSLVLAIAFASMAIHPFLPVREMGLLLAFALAFGLLSDLYLLPGLLLTSRR